MQLNSLTTGLCACVGLLLALDSIPVVEGNLVAVHTLVAVEGNLVADTPVDILVEAAGILVVEILVEAADTPVDTLVEAAEILVEETLEVAFVALQNRIVAARADQDLSRALLLVVVQVVVLLLVVRMVVPGCSYVSPP